MKKFSNISIKEEIKNNEHQGKEFYDILEKNMHVNITSDDSKYIKENVGLSGMDTLAIELESILQREKLKNTHTLLSQLESTMINDYNDRLVTSVIKSLSEKFKENTPNPENIFCNEDFETRDNFILLKNITNIPSDSYIDHLNINSTNNYFAKGNSISIRKIDENWHLSFNMNGLNYEDYRFFVMEGKNFISDFIRATSELIGENNITLDNILITNI